MQLTTLIPLLTLLATPVLSSSSHSSPLERRNAHAKLIAREESAALHARAAERIASQVAKREAPVALKEKPRKIKRGGASGCRVRGASFSPSAASSTSSTAAAATTSATTTTQAPASTTATTTAPTEQADVESQASASASPSTNNLAANAQISVGISIGGGSNNNGGGGSSNVALTPNGIKAGLSGTDTIPFFGNHVSWFWNYGPDPDTNSNLVFMPTLWGNGNQGGQDWTRLQEFQQINWNPQYVQGFYEPDCSPPMSSSIDPVTAAWQWNLWVVPWRAKGALLVSPGMCKQFNEDWLTPFLNAGAAQWDITSIHINKLDLAGAQADVDYYWNTYGKPIWVTEFACVDDQNGFVPSTDQGQINQYINDLVNFFEGDSRIAAYSMSEGMGLGDVWPPYANGQLTESGQTYLNAVSQYH